MTIWKFDLLFLAVGAVTGAYLRYRIGSNQISFLGIPLTILFINVVGSLILGLSMSAIQKFGLNQSYIILLGVGFCGSLTTMSSFAYETASLLDAGKMIAGFMDIVLNVGLSILAVFVGRALITVISGLL
ncbi:MAG: fluoride efflux transporter CrcB [Rhabdochlamydiaceae bacterium]